jgi:hypothetical protein
VSWHLEHPRCVGLLVAYVVIKEDLNEVCCIWVHSGSLAGSCAASITDGSPGSRTPKPVLVLCHQTHAAEHQHMDKCMGLNLALSSPSGPLFL